MSKRDSIGRTRKSKIGPNERAKAKRSLEKEAAGGKLGPNERASLKKYKGTLPKPKTETKPKPKTTDKPKPKTTHKPKPKTTDKPKPKTTDKPKKKDALKTDRFDPKGKVKDFNTKPGLAKAVKKSKEPSAAEKKKSDMEAWIKKTRNSPAQRSGAWKGQEHKLYEQHLRHKAWKASRKKKK